MNKDCVSPAPQHIQGPGKASELDAREMLLSRPDNTDAGLVKSAIYFMF